MTDEQSSTLPDWLDPTGSGDDEVAESQIDEYDLASSPNDFNVLTMFSFLESGAVKFLDFSATMFGT